MDNDSQGYRPSVPISVYRQLANELEIAKQQVRELKARNQNLVEQNKVMRNELGKMSQSVQTLQQLSKVYDIHGNFIQTGAVENAPESLSSPPVESSPPLVASPPPPPPSSDPRPDSPPTSYYQQETIEPDNSSEFPSEFDAFSDELVFEMNPNPIHRLGFLDRSTNISGWLVGFAVALMVFTAFGAGYLFIRPLLSNDRD